MDLFSSIGIQEVILILVIALIFVGPGKIAEFGTTLGKTINKLKRTSFDLTSTLKKELLEEKKQQETSSPKGLKTAENPTSGKSTIDPKPSSKDATGL